MTKKILNSIAVLLSAVMFFSVIPFAASAAKTEQNVGASSGTTGDCTWTLDGSGALTISGNGQMADYWLYYDDSGEEYVNYPWGNDITSVTIESGVTNIGAFAFYDCYGLTDVTISDSVTVIDPSAFEDCIRLTAIDIPDSVTVIGYGAFRDCSRLISVKTPESLTTIGVEAFRGCEKLTGITIPAGVTSIGDEAFYNCFGLTSVYIYDLTAWCRLSFMVYLNIYGSSNPVFYTHNFYVNNELVTDMVIPDGVESIGKAAFCGYRKLTSVTIPDSVTKINAAAFFCCGRLKNAGIADSVTSIEAYAFYGCESMKSVTIPESVTEIGAFAFGYLNRYEKIEDFTIYGKAGTDAERYANENGFKFVVGEEPAIKTGDVNLDGSVDIKDVTVIQSALADFTSLTDEQRAAADINGSGDVSITDATRLQMYLAEFEVELG